MRSSGQAFKSGLDKAFASLGVAGNDLGILTSASKLKGSISEEDIDADIKFIRPNFDHEFDEAKRYREFKRMPKKEWIEFAKDGTITTFSKIKNFLGNVDLDFEKLDKEKRARFQAAFKNKKIEAPIVVKFKKDDYDLLGGNTRLAGLLKKGINPKLWVIDMSKAYKEETKEQTSKMKSNKPKSVSSDKSDIEKKHKNKVTKKETKEVTGTGASLLQRVMLKYQRKLKQMKLQVHLLQDNIQDLQFGQNHLVLKTGNLVENLNTKEENSLRLKESVKDSHIVIKETSRLLRCGKIRMYQRRLNLHLKS